MSPLDAEKGGKVLMDNNERPTSSNLPRGDGEDILALQHLDPVLDMKMHLVNNVSERMPI